MSRVEDMRVGEEFQDFVRRALWSDRFPVDFNQSRAYQLSIGEGPVLEVKLDRRWRDTGNFYIETEELRRGNDEYSPSGIYRGDEPWMWALGDKDEFFLLPKRLLQILDTPRYSRAEAKRPDDTPTHGYLFPVDDLRHYSARHYVHGKAAIICDRCASECSALRVDGVELVCPDCAW